MHYNVRKNILRYSKPFLYTLILRDFVVSYRIECWSKIGRLAVSRLTLSHVWSRRAPHCYLDPWQPILSMFFSLHPLQLRPRSVTNDFADNSVVLRFSSVSANADLDHQELSFGPNLLDDVLACVS